MSNEYKKQSQDNNTSRQPAGTNRPGVYNDPKKNDQKSSDPAQKPVAPSKPTQTNY